MSINASEPRPVRSTVNQCGSACRVPGGQIRHRPVECEIAGLLASSRGRSVARDGREGFAEPAVGGRVGHEVLRGGVEEVAVDDHVEAVRQFGRIGVGCKLFGLDCLGEECSDALDRVGHDAPLDRSDDGISGGRTGECDPRDRFSSALFVAWDTETVTGELLGSPNVAMSANLDPDGQPKLFIPWMAAGPAPE